MGGRCDGVDADPLSYLCALNCGEKNPLVAGAVTAGKIRYVKNKLIKKGAITADSAVRPEDAGFTSSNDRTLLSQMLAAKRVARTEDGRVWWKG